MAIDVSRIPAYYTTAFVGRHANGCAQSAMASMFVYFGLTAFAPNLADVLCERGDTKPDVFFGWAGTSWERVRDVFRATGLHGDANNVAVLETVNEAVIGQKLAWIAASVHSGVPVCVILGNGEINEALGGHWGLLDGAHWGIVVDVDGAGNVVLANFPDPGGVIRLPAAGFRNAWKARWLPGVHYAYVSVHR